MVLFQYLGRFEQIYKKSTVHECKISFVIVSEQFCKLHAKKLFRNTNKNNLRSNAANFLQIFINPETMSNNGLIENMDLPHIHLDVYIKLPSGALHSKALYGRALYGEARQCIELQGGELHSTEFHGGAHHSKLSWAELSMADLIVSQEKFEIFHYLLFISC